MNNKIVFFVLCNRENLSIQENATSYPFRQLSDMY